MPRPLLRGWRGEAEVTESSSTARRVYLLLVIAGAVLCALGALVLLLNRVLALILGVEGPRNLAEEVATPLGVLLVALLVGGLHFAWLRRDQAVIAAFRQVEQVVEAEPPAPPIRRQLVLTVPAGVDVAAALDGLRSGLPEGYRLDEAG